MTKESQILQLGNPTLRKKAAIVKNIQAENIQKLINTLLKIVIEVDGIGIAAPQINKSYQVFIVASHPNKRYPKAPKIKPLMVINPKIISHSRAVIKDWEGCLSIPGVRDSIPRYKSIEVEYYTRSGGKIREKLTGFIARIFQHEYDHLNGLVFLDRLKNNKNIITDKEYQKLILK